MTKFVEAKVNAEIFLEAELSQKVKLQLNQETPFTVNAREHFLVELSNTITSKANTSR